MRDEQKQENSGAGAVQINGNHNTVNHHTHHHKHTVYAHGPVVIHTLVQQQAPFALQAPPAPPARKGKRTKDGPEITLAQKELLALMKPLPPHLRIQVLNWMRAEYGTGLVIELDPRELHRTRGHVLDVRRSTGV